jgi:hypothetical protein
MANPARAPSTPSPASDEPTYEGDLYAWSMRQSEHLRAGNYGALDLQRLAEEIEDVGKSERDKLRSAVTVLIQHILKWEYQPEKRTRSWESTIREHRRRIVDLLDENPSLKAQWSSILTKSYDDAADRAAGETGHRRSVFPESNPYGYADLMTRFFDLP